jgi:hypothetical protein
VVAGDHRVGVAALERAIETIDELGVRVHSMSW